MARDQILDGFRGVIGGDQILEVDVLGRLDESSPPLAPVMTPSFLSFGTPISAERDGIPVYRDLQVFCSHSWKFGGEDDAVLLPFTQAKQILDRIKRLCLGRSVPDAAACEQMDRQTRDGADMRTTRDRLARAAQSVIGKSEERAVASLFSPGGTHALEGGFAGSEDFEVVAFLEIIPVKAT